MAVAVDPAAVAAVAAATSVAAATPALPSSASSPSSSSSSPAPALETLRRPDNRAETFGLIRDWAKPLSRGGSLEPLEEALRALSAEHRHALAHFLWKESQSGPRSARARELLQNVHAAAGPPGAIPNEEQEWSPAVEAATAESAAQSFGFLEEPPAESGLPSGLRLKDLEADGKELFQDLRKWARQHRQSGDLESFGAQLGSSYRLALFEWLASFCSRKTVFRQQAEELFRELSAMEPWVRNLSTEKDAGPASPQLPMLRRESSGEGSVEHASSVSTGDEEGPCGAECEPPPSIEELHDAKGNSQELLLRLCAWINAERRRQQFEKAVSQLDPEHLEVIKEFLCAEPAEVAEPAEPAPVRRYGATRMMNWAREKTTRRGSKTAAAGKAAAPPPLQTCDRQVIYEALMELGPLFAE